MSAPLSEAPDVVAARIAFVEKNLGLTFRGVIQRDAKKIARTTVAVLASTTGVHRRTDAATSILRECFGGVVWRDAKKIAEVVVYFNRRFDELHIRVVPQTDVSA